MFVCLCNALTDRELCAAAETCERVADVYQCCGCKPDCGKCVPYVRDLLRQKSAEVTVGAASETCNSLYVEAQPGAG